MGNEMLMRSLQPVPSTVNFGRAEVNGIRMYYRMAGSGEPVVLLHGFPETSNAWRKVMPALAEHYTVIVPDLRGSVASDRPDTGYDKRTVAEDIHQLVHLLGLGPINLVSHDAGMMVGYAYASAYGSEASAWCEWRQRFQVLVLRSYTMQTSTPACITYCSLKHRTDLPKH